MRRNRIMINTGTTSLIMIFAVLALVTFAALSLSASAAGRRLAEKMAERTTDYYNAEREAMERLAKIEKLLAQTGAECSREEFLSQARSAVENKEDVSWEEGLICWEVPIQEGQYLAAAARPLYADKPGEAVYEIVSWETRDEGEWENEQTLELYGAGEME